MFLNIEHISALEAGYEGSDVPEEAGFEGSDVCKTLFRASSTISRSKSLTICSV